ncbi:MAG TPA: c-type cytochrome [Gemmataceae bacterium]|nr:c-type cytochrome [Gemmataceae bacterium]
MSFVSFVVSSSPLDPLVGVLAQSDDPAVQLDVLKGMHAALFGRKQVAMPDGWPAAFRKLRESRNEEVRDLAFRVALDFGDAEALAILRKTAADTAASTAARQTAVQALVQKRDPELVPLLQSLLTDKTLRGAALRGLAAYSDRRTPERILAVYPSLTDAEKRDAINTLASRRAYAVALVAALEKGQVPRKDLDAFTVRQLHGLNDKELSARLNKAWGTIRRPSEEKAALIARYRKLLTPDSLKKADLPRGRLLFERNCASCHTLFNEGGKVGPELTGSQRANLDYVLENMIDPSAVVAREYQVSIVATKYGRVINGIVKREDERSLTLQTPNDVVTVAKDDIEAREQSRLSLMPEGLLQKLSDAEVRDLVAYLASPKQVPLPGPAGR